MKKNKCSINKINEGKLVVYENALYRVLTINEHSVLLSSNVFDRVVAKDMFKEYVKSINLTRANKLSISNELKIKLQLDGVSNKGYTNDICTLIVCFISGDLKSTLNTTLYKKYRREYNRYIELLNVYPFMRYKSNRMFK